MGTSRKRQLRSTSTDSEHREEPPSNDRPLEIEIDGQLCVVRCTRGRKTKFVRRLLRGLLLTGDLVDNYAVIARWEPELHELFWDLVGYDGGLYVDGRNDRENIAGMMGESKRVLAELTR